MCGGVATHTVRRVGGTGADFTITLPPAWDHLDAESTYEDFRCVYDGWTLDLYVGPRSFRLGRAHGDADACLRYGACVCAEPQPPLPVTPRLFLRGRGPAFAVDAHERCCWNLLATVDLTYKVLTLDIALYFVHGEPWEWYGCDDATVTSLLPCLRRSHWNQVRGWVKLRSIVLYWEECTAHQMQPGGTAYRRDVAAAARMFDP